MTDPAGTTAPFGGGVLAYAGDFRSSAVQASELLLRDVAGDVDALEVSTCTLIAGATDADFRRAYRDAVFTTLGSIGLIVVIVGSTALAVSLEQLWLLLTALVLASLSLPILMGLILRRSRMMRRIISSRGIDCTGVGVPLPPRCVNIEDGLTYRRLKMAPEDAAMLWADPQRRCVRVEGLTHRYIIYAADVTSTTVRRAPAMSSTSVTYRIGNVDLALVFSENQSNLLEIFSQTFGRRPRLHPILMNALGNGGEIVDAIAEPGS